MTDLQTAGDVSRPTTAPDRNFKGLPPLPDDLDSPPESSQGGYDNEAYDRQSYREGY